MTQKSELGAWGENKACEYLVDRGYKIIERNFREPWGEIDIVAKAGDGTLVFVEVKTMTENYGGLKPEDQMTSAKIKKFKKVAALYAGHRQDLVDDKKGFRLDLLALTRTEDDCVVTHYENVV